jgi:serine/threonine protein kinase
MRALKGLDRVPALVAAYDNRIIMEMFRGGTVTDRINSKPFSENTVKSIVRGAARGIYQCHSRGVIHMDIKPSNIMFSDESDDAHMKLIDFSHSRMFYTFNKRVDLSSMSGTLWYMSPEVLSCAALPASDIWSLGVTTYQLLTGKMPFNDLENPTAPRTCVVYKSIFTNEPKMEGKRWEGLSPESKDFVKMLLRTDPLDRPGILNVLGHPWLDGNVEERHSGPVFDQKKKNSIINYTEISAAKAKSSRRYD